MFSPDLQFIDSDQNERMGFDRRVKKGERRKKSTFKDMIAKGSIKLRIRSELTEKEGDKVASIHWKDTAYKSHENEMMQLLKTSLAKI